MRVCHIVPSLEERHGGPSKSVRALANSLARLGESVELLATAEPGQPSMAAGRDESAIHVFPRATPRWLSRSPKLRQHLHTVRYDCIHSHSLWLRPLHYAHEAALQQNVPLIISPRGMMSGWAYRHRRWRKRLAEILVHPGAFAGAAGWHATSAGEAEDIRQLGFQQPICVSPNGVVLPNAEEMATASSAWNELCPSTQTRPVALFYSRFHRKKRLRELIDLWLSVSRGDWLLLIVGVAEEYTAAELTACIGAAGAQDRIAVFDGANQPPPYGVASLFLLPSHTENFGLVIAEALAAGVPALVTDTTPWQGLATHDCGWCVPWEDFGRTLSQALATRQGTLEVMGAQGRTWTEQEFSWDCSAKLLRDFYYQLSHEPR